MGNWFPVRSLWTSRVFLFNWEPWSHLKGSEAHISVIQYETHFDSQLIAHEHAEDRDPMTSANRTQPLTDDGDTDMESLRTYSCNCLCRGCHRLQRRAREGSQLILQACHQAVVTRYRPLSPAGTIKVGETSIKLQLHLSELLFC